MTTVKVRQEWTHTFDAMMWAVYDEGDDTWTFYAYADDDGGVFHYPACADEEDAAELEAFPREDVVADLGITGTDWDELTPDERSRMITWMMNEE